jgi:hypothetical protein
VPPFFASGPDEGEGQLHTPAALSPGTDGLDAVEHINILPLPGN